MYRINDCMLLPFSFVVCIHVLAVQQVVMATVSVCVSQLAMVKRLTLSCTESHIKVSTHTVLFRQIFFAYKLSS